jgi:hypothetical protein
VSEYKKKSGIQEKINECLSFHGHLLDVPFEQVESSQRELVDMLRVDVDEIERPLDLEPLRCTISYLLFIERNLMSFPIIDFPRWGFMHRTETV